MGEISDSIINGDFDEVSGEYLGEGGGFPRTRYGQSKPANRLDRLNSIDYINELGHIQRLLIGEGYIITEMKRHDYDTQIRLSTGGIINLYHNKKIVIQGKPDEKLNKIFQ